MSYHSLLERTVQGALHVKSTSAPFKAGRQCSNVSAKRRRRRTRTIVASFKNANRIQGTRKEYPLPHSTCMIPAQPDGSHFILAGRSNLSIRRMSMVGPPAKSSAKLLFDSKRPLSIALWSAPASTERAHLEGSAAAHLEKKDPHEDEVEEKQAEEHVVEHVHPQQPATVAARARLVHLHSLGSPYSSRRRRRRTPAVLSR